MAIKARFYIPEVRKTMHGLGVKLLPVVRPTNDNIEWSKYTPSGEFNMTVTDESAAAWFEAHLGKDVSITFEDPEEVLSEAADA